MTNVISLIGHRVQRARAGLQRHPPVRRLIEAQNILAGAVRELRTATRRLGMLASRLEGIRPIEQAVTDRQIHLTLEGMRQCRADCEAITRLIDAGDIDGCLRLRDAILARALVSDRINP
jgi:hypothetical protein